MEEEYKYYIRPVQTDMRKGAASLAYLVQYEMGLEPFSKCSCSAGRSCRRQASATLAETAA